jgi:hypothetical protein
VKPSSPSQFPITPLKILLRMGNALNFEHHRELRSHSMKD